jgi:hypothetical protein
LAKAGLDASNFYTSENLSKKHFAFAKIQKIAKENGCLRLNAN